MKAAATLCVMMLVTSTPFVAQDQISHVGELYETADYEEALKLLDQIGPDGGTPAGRQTAREYRALCLIALDRLPEAEMTMEAMVEADPFYYPDRQRRPRRMLTAFDRVRHRVLRSLVHQRYADAAGDLEAKRYAKASDGFDMVLRLVNEGDASLLDDPDLPSVATISAKLKAAREAMRAENDQRKAEPGRIVFTSADPGVTPPVPIRQELPPWQPAPSSGARFDGELEVLIDSTGDVRVARIVKPIHPTYDPILLDAAKKWRYRPAMKDGRPVAYRKVITLDLAPLSGR
jgi:hypothetical protein